MQSDNSKFKKDFLQRLIRFSLETITLCAELRKERNLSAIADQLIRSATSVGANVVEAKGASSTKDYIRFFEIALKSANETKYWLILTKEAHRNLAPKAETLLGEVDEIAKIIGASILTMKGKR